MQPIALRDLHLYSFKCEMKDETPKPSLNQTAMVSICDHSTPEGMTTGNSLHDTAAVIEINGGWDVYLDTRPAASQKLVRVSMVSLVFEKMLSSKFREGVY